jgi:tetratricopeptide (TPR) repeat protein
MNEEAKILKIENDCPACKKASREGGRIPVARIIEKLDAHFKKNDLEGAKRLLEYWQSEAISLSDESGELSVVNELLGLYRKISYKTGAEKAILRAEELLSKTKREDTVSGATVMLNAATTCKAFGMLEKAITLYERVYEIYKAKLSPDDTLFSAFYNNYSTALVDAERYEEALEYYRRAVSITEQSVSTLLDCAITYINMAHLYEKRNGIEASEIEELLLKAEEIFEDERIEKDSYYAFVAEKCAPSFDYFGFFMTALNLKKKSREIYEGA